MTEQQMLYLIKASLFQDEPVDIPDWEAVFAEMKEQTVAALPGEWLKRHPIPEASLWTAFITAQKAQWIRVMYAQEQLLKLLGENDIPCVIIKGSAAAMSYPYPSLRSMGDVDVLVKRNDFNQTVQLLERSGYTMDHGGDGADNHYGYLRDGVSFEIHRRLAVICEDDDQRLALLEAGIDQRELRETEGFSFPVLPEALNGLVLLFHIDQHLRDGLGLRQIIDWMMYMDQLDPHIWQEELLPLLRDTGTERLALTVTVMCQKYLGLRTIVEEKEDYPCEELMDYILEKGNFGRKAGLEGQTASFALSASDSRHLFRRLQAGGMIRWKAAQRHKILRPFAWLYQTFRILGIFRKNGIKPGEVVELQRKGVGQRELIEALGLSVDRTIQ